MEIRNRKKAKKLVLKLATRLSDVVGFVTFARPYTEFENAEEIKALRRSWKTCHFPILHSATWAQKSVDLDYEREESKTATIAENADKAITYLKLNSEVSTDGHNL